MSGTAVQVINDDLCQHPKCAHGPTLLFKKRVNGIERSFFACSACRDRKLCSFFLYKDELHKYNQEVWKEEAQQFLKNINHNLSSHLLNQIRQLPSSKRGYCHTCSGFQLEKSWQQHKTHNFITNIDDKFIRNPTKFLMPLDNAKKEAQFLFSDKSVNTISKILDDLSYEKIINVGTPRIHEFIKNNKPRKTSILLDIDDRFHNFYGPQDFCWYNYFNNYFFLSNSEDVFHEFLKSKKNNAILIMDPPFGGRVEPLAQTINTISTTYKKLNKFQEELAIFLIFPYFMEPQILNSLPNFFMLDYKVDYDNHPLFKGDAKKLGSIVRIFTNINPSKIQLPETEGYKFCSLCERWTFKENKHCFKCNNCTSKDGRIYIHCSKCKRCVKSMWQHCEKCKRCSQPNHKCEELEFTQECFNCKQMGHKKRNCPEIEELQMKNRKQKRRKLC